MDVHPIGLEGDFTMLLGEPSETRADLRFRLFGFPVRVHPFFWVVMVLLGIGTVESRQFRFVVGELFIWAVAAFLSVLIHELGHALVLRAYGFRPSITLYGFGGYASYDRSESDRVREPGNLGQILISGAGPGAQVLLAVGLAVVLYHAGHVVAIYAWGPLYFVLPGEHEIIVNEGVTLFVRDLMLVSAFWAYFNLLPVYPLDGGRIARGILVAANPKHGARQSLILSILVSLALAIVGLVTQDRMLMYFFLFLTYANAQALQAHGR